MCISEYYAVACAKSYWSWWWESSCSFVKQDHLERHYSHLPTAPRSKLQSQSYYIKKCMHVEGLCFIWLKGHACKWEGEKAHTYTGAHVCTDKSPIGEHGKGSSEAKGSVQSSCRLRLRNYKRDPRKDRLCTVNKAASAIQLQVWGKQGVLYTLHRERELSHKITSFLLSTSPKEETCYPTLATNHWS